ncbi:hypothetical protein IMZ48_02640 [Candidatus Bathyarchaeota archaeon]|nr:hypothetical protein [Candidatus Bathyarchaeota archaeon]
MDDERILEENARSVKISSPDVSEPCLARGHPSTWELTRSSSRG